MKTLNTLGADDPISKFGWIGKALSVMGNTRRWAVSLNPSNQIIINQSFPLMMVHDSPVEVLNACRIAVQGEGAKTINQSLAPSPAANFTVSAGTKKVFGVRVRISNSVLNFKFGTYNIQLLDGAVLLGQVFVVVKELPLDIVMLGISNVSGQATIIPIAVPNVTMNSADNPALVAGSDVVHAESLNMRDIGNIPNAERAGAIA